MYVLCAAMFDVGRLAPRQHILTKVYGVSASFAVTADASLEGEECGASEFGMHPHQAKGDHAQS